MAESNGAPQLAEEQANSASTPTDNRAKFETWGYDMYPERRQTSSGFSIKDFFSWKARDNVEQYKCEKAVVNTIKKSR